MATLIWDAPGERTYQTGVDRGVLYLQDGRAVVWNGLTSVEDTTEKELNESYLDGFKYLEYLIPGDFSANLKAFTYPNEFDEVNGVLQFDPGLRAHDQPSKSFCLSYRTRIGDDLDSDAGYIIHILYNILANPDSQEYVTLKESLEPVEFSWVLRAKPIRNNLFSWRPTAHFSMDSRETSSELLQFLEDILYGTEDTDPRIPTIEDIFNFTIGSPPPPEPEIEILTADFTISIEE